MRLLKLSSPPLAALILLALSFVSRGAQGDPLPDGQEAFEAARQDIPDDLSEDAKDLLLALFGQERVGPTITDRLADKEGLPAEILPYLVEIVGRENVSDLRGSRVKFATPGVRAWGLLSRLAEEYPKAFTDSAVPKLVEVLADDSKAEYARADAAKMLGWSRSPAGQRALIRALESDSSDVRVSAARSLGEIGNLSRLTEALDTDDERLQLTILAVFRRSGPKAWHALPAVIEMLDDDRVAIRRAAAEALGAIGSRTAVVPLCRAVADEDPRVQMYAARALGALEDPRATTALIAALEADNPESPKPSLCAALGAIRDRRAVPALVAALSDERTATRRTAATALGNIADVRAVESLIAAIEDEDAGVVIEAASALGKLNDPRAIEPLVRVLVSPGRKGKLYEAAAESLRAIRHPDVVYVLIDHLPDESGRRLNDALEILDDLTGLFSADWPKTMHAAEIWRQWKAEQLQAGDQDQQVD